MDTRNEAQFNEGYADLAFIQKRYNEQLFIPLVGNIETWFADKIARNEPIQILDLCCGDGSSTYSFQRLLRQRGIIANIVGADISAAQINAAKAYENGSLSLAYQDGSLSFRVQDAETLDERNKYDLVICLFGLHWINDHERMIERIHAACVAEGRVCVLVPLQNTEFDTARDEALATNTLHTGLIGFRYKPLEARGDHYARVMSGHFDPDLRHSKHGRDYNLFSREDFIRFFSSWVQELREYRAQLQRERLSESVIDRSVQIYANKMAEHIKPTALAYPECGVRDGKYTFLQGTFMFFGKRRAQPDKSHTMHVPPEPTPLQAKLLRGFKGF